MAIRWETLGPRKPAVIQPAVDDIIVNSEPLARFLAHATVDASPVLLLVNDPHRATRTRPVLAALARLHAERGIRPRYRILVATGTHRFAAAERKAFATATWEGCGLDIEATAWHDATDDAALAPSAGVRMHRWLGESHFLLAIGSVEPHYFAGLTGAHKTLTIGCTARADIERNHAGALDPASDCFRLEGNPVFDGVADIARALEAAGQRICAINQVVCDKRIVETAVGHWRATLDALLPTVRSIYAHQIAQPADILHLRVPLPLGRNLYQADKALKNNHRAVRDGGGVILEAECREGVGPDAFMNLLREAPDYPTAVRIVRRRGYSFGDHKAVKLRHLTDPAARGVRVAVLSTHLSETDAATAGLRRFDDVDAALGWLSREIRHALEHGLRIEDAGNVVVTTR